MVKADNGGVEAVVSIRDAKRAQKAARVCRDEDEEREAGRVKQPRVMRLETTKLHLMHCRSIPSFDLTGIISDMFFILLLLDNHFSGKHGVQ